MRNAREKSQCLPPMKIVARGSDKEDKAAALPEGFVPDLVKR
jgi:hypothetical protein